MLIALHEAPLEYTSRKQGYRIICGAQELIWLVLFPALICCAMASITVARLRQIAEQTAEEAKEQVLETTGFASEAELRGEYLGQVDKNKNTRRVGSANDGVPKRARLEFLFRCVNRGSEAIALRNVRCDHIKERAVVPMPPFWKSWLSASAIPQKAAALASELCAAGRIRRATGPPCPCRPGSAPGGLPRSLPRRQGARLGPPHQGPAPGPGAAQGFGLRDLAGRRAPGGRDKNK